VSIQFEVIRRPVTATAPEPSRRRPWPVFWVVAIGYLVQAGLRLWWSWGVNFPRADPDEIGYLIAARILSGGAHADLTGATFYQAGYPLLLTPAYWFSHDPHTVYRIAVGENALINALVFPLAHLAARRLGLSRGWALPLAFGTALLPAVVFYSEYVLADTVMPVVVLGWLLACHRWLTSAAWPAAVAGSLLAGYAYAAHTRGDVIVAVHAALIVVAALRRWVPRSSALVAAAVLTVTCGAAKLLNLWLLARDYPRGARDLGGLLTRRLLSVGGQERTIAGAAGQLWYQICATWGLAGIGIIVLFVVVFRGSRTLRTLAAMTLLTVAGIAYASTAALPDEHRIGNYLYGRYLACLAPVLVIVAVVALRRLSRRAALLLAAGSLGLAVVSGGVAWAYAGDRIYDYLWIGFDFPEYGLLNGGWAGPAHLHAMLVAFLLLAAVIAPLLWRRTRPAVLAVLLAINLVAVNQCSSRWHGHPITDTVIDDAGLHPPQLLVVDWNVPWTFSFPLEYSAWWTKLSFIHATSPLAGAASAAVVAWPPHTPPECTWPAAPAGWRVAGAHRSGPYSWVTWTKNPPKSSLTTPAVHPRCVRLPK
jgi:hypothetical protein